MELFFRSGGVIRSILRSYYYFNPALEQELVLLFYSCTLYSSSSAAILLFYVINHHFGQAFQCVVLKFFLVQFPAQVSCNQGAEAPPHYVVASVWERQEAVLSLTECQGARGSQKFIKTRGRPAPAKTRMDAEDKPEDQNQNMKQILIDQDHLEGQAQSQMLHC